MERAESAAQVVEHSGQWGSLGLPAGRGDSSRRVVGLKPVKVAEFEAATAMIKDLMNGRPVEWNGNALHDPHAPYHEHDTGPEETSRKPAYHNGTAWTWTFPVFCEALAIAWDFDKAAVGAAKHYLASMERLLDEGCLGHLPEIVDGDAPHTQRGCDAQAWGATEALRVWKLLGGI